MIVNFCPWECIEQNTDAIETAADSTDAVVCSSQWIRGCKFRCPWRRQSAPGVFLRCKVAVLSLLYDLNTWRRAIKYPPCPIHFAIVTNDLWATKVLFSSYFIRIKIGTSPIDQNRISEFLETVNRYFPVDEYSACFMSELWPCQQFICTKSNFVTERDCLTMQP